MSETIKFFDGMIEERLAHVRTAIPCRIEKYDETKGTADVVPLFMIKNKDEAPQPLPMQVSVPVLKQKKRSGDTIYVETPYYDRGDIVLVVYCDRAIDRLEATSQPFDPEFERKHALEDGIIIGFLR